MERRYTPENITELNENEIFVFGSNIQGQHCGGAARVALLKFGAKLGQGIGLQGRSYAIPTMQGGIETIQPYVDEFVNFADLHPELTFFVTRIGCGIAGFKDQEIAPLFDKAYDIQNIILPQSFTQIINHKHRLDSEIMGLESISVAPIKYFEEDLAKSELMSHEERNDFFGYLKRHNLYTIAHDLPSRSNSGNFLNTTDVGNHNIAISENSFVVIVGQKIYSNLFRGGMVFDIPVSSIVARELGYGEFSITQFVILLSDGSIKVISSNLNIINLSDENDFTAIATGCNGLVFGLKRNGNIETFFKECNVNVYKEVIEWNDIIQIDAGPRHVVGLRRDGTVVASGKPSACDPLKAWKNIKKIYVSKAAPSFFKSNDLTFGIDNMNWLHVDGDCWTKSEEFWKRIRAQYDVEDVVENGTAVWVRLLDGEIRCVYYHSKMNYLEEIEFVQKYKDFLYMDSYGNLIVLVDKDGEFRVMNNYREVRWWDFGLI